MSQNPLVIMHGWSDAGASLVPLAQFLRSKLGRPAQLISLADYVSMDDAVTFRDLVHALDRAWDRHGLPRSPRSADVVVHSAGALIIRDWMSSHFPPDAVPIHHLVMLAPANFGSPLAHKGASFIGRVIKGFTNDKMFHVGAALLGGLELASPYTWALATRDCFDVDRYFGAGRVLATVLVGNTGFTGIAAAANSEGSDGVVRCSTANLNSAMLHADFTTPHEPRYSMQRATGEAAFAVLDGENHSSIALKQAGGFKSDRTADFIVRSLRVSDAEFFDWCSELAAHTAGVMHSVRHDPMRHGYQNTVVYVHDQHGEPVHDYFLEFYLEHDDRDRFAELFHRRAIRSVHINRGVRAIRSVLIDCTTLDDLLDTPGESLKVSLTAQPDLESNGNVGFRTFRDRDMDGITIPHAALADVFQPNRTLFVDITLRREQREHLLRLTRTAG